MPKTNDASGATYLGHEGIVEHAGGAGSTRPGGLSEVDVSRNLDGTVIDGYDSEEREIEDREGAHPAEPILLPPREEEPETREEPKEETKEKEEQTSSNPAFSSGQEKEQGTEQEEVPSSPGSSSAASRSNSVKPSAKSAAKPR